MRNPIAIALTLIVLGSAIASDNSSGQEKEDSKLLLPADGVWKLKLGGGKEASYNVSIRNGVLTGHRVTNGVVEKRCCLTGQVEEGPIPIILVRNDIGIGYVSYWIGRYVEGGRIRAVWVDNSGNEGQTEIAVETK